MAIPLQSALVRWNERAAQANALGIPESAYKTIAQRDIDRIKQTGTGLTDTEAALAIRASMGQPTVQYSRGTRARDIPGNVLPDLQETLRNFVPGIAKTIWNAPSDLKALAQLAMGDQEVYRSYASKHGQPEEVNDLGEVFQFAARDPILSLLPGVTTVGRATSPQGREELAQHPIQTFLDLLPFAAKAGKVATKGKVAEAGSAIESLQAGRPVRAGFRATTDLVSKTPKVGTYLSRERWNKFADDFGTSDRMRELARAMSVTQRRADKEAKAYIQDNIMPLWEGMDDPTRLAFHDYATQYRNGMPASERVPEFDALLDPVRDIEHRLATESEAQGGITFLHVPGVEKPVKYSVDSPVIRANRRMINTQELVGRIDHRLGNAELVKEKWDNNLTNREGKVRHFMESEEAFNTRSPGPVSPEVLREAMRPFVESFQFIEPQKVFREYLDKIVDGQVRAQTAAFLNRDFKKLQGETGLVARLDEALQRADIKEASQLATQINRVFKNKAWDNFDTSTRLRRHITDIREELVALRKRTTSYGYAARMAKKADERVANYQLRLKNARERLDDRTQSYLSELESNPPASYKPLLISQVRTKSIEAARELYHGQQLQDVIQTLERSPLMAEMRSLVGDKAFKEIWQSTIRGWVDLAREGYDPVWLHHVPTSRFDSILKPRLLPDAELKPTQWRDATMNFGPGVMDIAVGMSAAASELIARKYTHEFITNYVTPLAVPKHQVQAELARMIRETGQDFRPSFGIAGEVDRLMRRSYRDYDPAKYGIKTARATTNDLVIPKGVDVTLNAFTRGFQYIPIRGVYDKVMKVYKTSVLFGAKQFSDVVFGGSLSIALREPKAFLSFPRVIDDFRAGRIPEELNHDFYEFKTDEVWQVKGAQTMGRHLAAIPGAIARMEENVSAIQRTAVYYAAMERAAKTGVDAAVAREAGLRTAYKVLLDFDGMSWIERAIVREAIPFYSFMRYTIKYVMTYPADHPLRAAILSKFAENESRDQKDGLAEKYRNYFRLGEMDENGNVKIVDYRTANPFQSGANLFTLGGLLSGINPLVTSAFEAAGLNLLTATPDLYPDMEYDPETGSLIAKRGGTIQTIAGNIVPQTEAVDYFFQFSDRMKRLKERNPEAYKRQLYTHLHLPWAGLEGAIPGQPLGELQVNVGNERAKAELGRYRAAREEVSQALEKNDFTALRHYSAVPYRGELVDPKELQAFWERINAALAEQGSEGLNPRAVIPRG